MKSIQKIKDTLNNSYTKVAAAVTVAVGYAATQVHATAILDNDTLEGMPELGSDLGDFMGNLAPGLGKFLLTMGIFLGIVGILAGVFYIIKKSVTRAR